MKENHTGKQEQLSPYGKCQPAMESKLTLYY